MTKRLPLAALFAAASLALAAPAAAATHASIQHEVRSAVSGSGQVFARLDGGVATIHGDLESLDRNAAAQAALAYPGVERVVNLVPQS